MIIDKSNTTTLDEVLVVYKKMFKQLIGKWKIILFLSVFGTMLGILYASFQKNKYTAQLNFVIESKGGGISSYASIASQFGIDLGSGGSGMFEGENLIQLIKSDRLLTKTLVQPFDNKETFISFFIKEDNLTKKNMQIPNYSNYETGSNWLADSLLNVVSQNILKNNLSVEKYDKKLDFVFIKFTYSHQLFGKKFVEQLTQNTIDFYIDYKSRKNSANVNLLQRQADSVRSLLFGGISEVASTNDLNVNPIKMILRANVQKKGVDVQVNTAVYSELQKNLQLARLVMLKESPIIKVIDTPRLPLKNLKFGRLFTGIIFGFVVGFLTSVFYLIYFYFKK